MNQPFADGLHAALLGVLDIGSAERGSNHSKEEGGSGSVKGTFDRYSASVGAVRSVTGS